MPIIDASHLVQGGDAGAYEPQKQNHWTFEVYLGDKSKEELISLSMDTAFEPVENNDTMELHFWNEKRKFAGKQNYDAGTIVLKDFVDIPTKDAVMEWRKLVFDPVTGAMGLAKVYKKEARVKLFAPDGTMQRAWSLIGCWPQSANWNSTGLDYSSAEACKIELTLEYDKALWKIDN